MAEIKKPAHPISPAFIKVQRIAESLTAAVVLLMLIALRLVSDYFDWHSSVGIVVWVLGGVLILYAVWSIGIAPMLMQRYWRYEVGDAFVQLQHGRLIRSNQLIPLTKIQYVELAQGPLLRSQRLFTVKIGTMGSNHAIPGLPEQEAYAVRERLAELAQIKEVEV